MKKKEKIIVGWSGGKDSSMMLYELFRSNRYEVEALLTTLTRDYDRVSMHGIRRTLVEDQAQSLGIPMRQVFISGTATNTEYETKMKEALWEFRKKGIETAAFGDIFLEDVKEYRDRLLSQVSLKGLYPLWKKDTSLMLQSFVDLGFKAVVTCVDTSALAPSFSGRLVDQSFIDDLPDSVDPCGERGEFHTFVFHGPLFKNEVQWAPGIAVDRGHFRFADLIPKKGEQRNV